MRDIPKLYPCVRLDKYVVMPNHIHCILVVSAQDGNAGRRDVRTIIGQYKMSVTKRIRAMEPGKQIWQRSFYDHVIRSQADYENIWRYIDDNPRRWKEDKFYIPTP